MAWKIFSVIKIYTFVILLINAAISRHVGKVCIEDLHYLTEHPPPPPPRAAYASVNRVSNGSDNGLSPIRRQAII